MARAEVATVPAIHVLHPQPGTQALVEDQLKPKLAGRLTEVPVVPPGARHATINTNGIEGGQPIDGPISPAQIAHQVVHEGVKKLVLVSDDPARHAASALPAGVRIEHRDRLDRHGGLGDSYRLRLRSRL